MQYSCPLSGKIVRAWDDNKFQVPGSMTNLRLHMREIEHYTLSNGIRVVHNRITTTKIVHCGIMLNIGSRDENPVNQGIAHFWEHMAFKGTKKRNAYHILNRLDSLGGELNAFTDKEKILFYASLRDVYFEKAVDLLTDITFDSVFPENQIDRERNVILEEMAMYLDDPEDSLHDEFDNVVFTNHPLGMNILGTQKTVKSFRRKDFQSFIKAHLDTKKIVFSCVGNIPMEEVIRLAEKYMGHLPRITSSSRRKRFMKYKPKELLVHRNVSQSRCAMGRPAYALKDERRSGFFMLVNILGGSGMNSRLNWALREKHGYVYSIGSHYYPFSDTGLFMISFGTEPRQMSKSLQLISEELRKLKEEPLGIKQMNAAREQLFGQLAMAQENNSSYMIMMARSMLDRGKVLPIEETYARIRATTPQTLLTLANDIFDEEQFSILRMEPN